MDVSRLLSVSTVHVSKATRDWLEVEGEKNSSDITREVTGGSVIHMASHYYGWMVWVPDENLDIYPQDLVCIIELARTRNCDWVNIDADGTQHDGLSEFEWTD